MEFVCEMSAAWPGGYPGRWWLFQWQATDEGSRRGCFWTGLRAIFWVMQKPPHYLMFFFFKWCSFFLLLYWSSFLSQMEVCAQFWHGKNFKISLTKRIYIYIYREREREREILTVFFIYCLGFKIILLFLKNMITTKG